MSDDSKREKYNEILAKKLAAKLKAESLSKERREMCESLKRLEMEAFEQQQKSDSCNSVEALRKQNISLLSEWKENHQAKKTKLVLYSYQAKICVEDKSSPLDLVKNIMKSLLSAVSIFILICF